MRRPRRRLAAIGTVLIVAVTSGRPVTVTAASTPDATRPEKPRAFLIHLIDGGDPIVVGNYVEEDGHIRFEKYGGWVGIPRYEVLRIVPDASEDADGTLPPAGAGDSDGTPLYVTTRSGATVRASTVDAKGSEVRVGTPEGSFRFHRGDLVGVLRVPPAPALPEAWITLWDVHDGSAGSGSPESKLGASAALRPPTLSNRPHLLQLASGVLIQVDGFWLEAGEIRFRRLGGVVGFALGEIARLLPQELEPTRGRLAARFVRRLGPDRLEVRSGGGLQRVRLIGVAPGSPSGALEDPWASLERGLLVQLEFDRERYGPDGDWLAYVYLPSGRMLNAELIRVGLARPRPESQNIRYLDLFQEIARTQPGN